MKRVISRVNLMRKASLGLFSLLIAAGFSSCDTESLKPSEQSGDAVKCVVNWSSHEDLVSALTSMEDMLLAAQSDIRAADPNMSIEAMQNQWDLFKYAVEPRPYAYDDGRISIVILDDFVHDKRKNVYEWWWLDPTDNGSGTRPGGTWKMRREHAEKGVILAVDRYWADPNALGGWKHSTEASPERREAIDRDWWISHQAERLSNYRATYIQIQTLSSELKKFLQDNGLFYESASQGRLLYEDMMSFLASNLSSSIVIDAGVADGSPLNPGPYDDGLGSNTEALIATYGYLLPSLVLDRLVLEWQQQPVNGFTSNRLPSPPPLHPDHADNGAITWTRGVASRGMLFEFFFGAITPTFVFPGDPYRPFPL